MKKYNRQIHLVLFLTTWMSLRRWDELGLLQREVALYNRLQPHVASISLVTYGDTRDLDYQDAIPGIKILCNQWRLPRYLYALLLPILYKSTFKQATIIKTNQTLGGFEALYVSEAFGVPLLARSGADLVFQTAQKPSAGWIEKQWTHWQEHVVFSGSVHLVTTSETIRVNYINRHRLNPDSITVIPNYVDTERLFPGRAQRPGRILFVGRLTRQKNVFNLVDAVKTLPVELTMIGDGVLYESLKQHLISNKVENVCLLGQRPYEDVVAELKSAEIFVLPSYYEGHPKALIEAMACGLPVIGANSPGISSVILDGVTGLLCRTDADSIRAAILRLMDDTTLRVQLGRAAHQAVVDRYSLDNVVQQELSLLEILTARPLPAPRKGAALRYLPRALMNLLVRGNIVLRNRLPRKNFLSS